jgi:hypothetical protein
LRVLPPTGAEEKADYPFRTNLFHLRQIMQYLQAPLKYLAFTHRHTTHGGVHTQGGFLVVMRHTEAYRRVLAVVPVSRVLFRHLRLAGDIITPKTSTIVTRYRTKNRQTSKHLHPQNLTQCSDVRPRPSPFVARPCGTVLNRIRAKQRQYEFSCSSSVVDRKKNI